MVTDSAGKAKKGGVKKLRTREGKEERNKRKSKKFKTDVKSDGCA